MTSASKPVAIVTGGASGIGTALVTHLVQERGYRVVIADLNAQAGELLADSLKGNAIFHQTDVSSYADQLSLSCRAFEWGKGLLDFFAANTGIDDRQDLFAKDQPTNQQGDLEPLNLKTLDSSQKKGKFIMTSSTAGLYGSPINPQYIAAKHGIVGLTRSAGPALGERYKQIVDMFPKERITPMSTIIKAYDAFLDNDDVAGEVAKCSFDNIHYRKQVEYADETQRWFGEDAMKLWEQGYQEPPKRD